MRLGSSTCIFNTVNTFAFLKSHMTRNRLFGKHNLQQLEFKVL